MTTTGGNHFLAKRSVYDDIVDAGAQAQGDRFQANSLWYPSYYEAIWGIIGTTATILPFGDSYHGTPAATTFTTQRATSTGVNATFTWSEAPNAFDTALNLASFASYQGVIPIVVFNGTDEEADSPDAAYFTRNDAGGEAFSIGFWAKVTNTAAARTVFAKFDTALAIQEYWLTINSSDKLEFRVRDDSVPIEVTRISDAAITMGSWAHFVMTYDGSGGASAMDGVTLYQDGAVIASTATNDGSYVAMENGTSTVSLCHSKGAAGAVTNPYSGSLAGGPLGPFFTQIALTADQVSRLYNIGRRALAL